MKSTVNLDTVKIQPLSTTLELHWAADHVASFIWRDVDKVTVDLFAEWYLDYLDDLRGKPVKLLIDLMKPRFSSIPYLRSKARYLVRQTIRRNLSGRVAILLAPNTLVDEMVTLYSKQYPLVSGNMEAGIFYDPDKALFWIQNTV